MHSFRWQFDWNRPAFWKARLARLLLNRDLAPAAAVMLLGVLALCSSAPAQQEPAYPQADSTNDTQARSRFSIGGSVVNSVTGEPVLRALVSVSNRQYTMTDSNGHFQVDGVPRGEVAVSAEKPGFFNPEQMESMQSPRVRASLTADIGDVVLKLMPQAVIAGRITSLAGGPIEDFPVRLYARKVVDGGAQWQSAGVAQTDEDGQFRIADLRPGEYFLSAGPEHKSPLTLSAERLEARAPNRQRGYAQVFYPNAAELASATAIDLLAGQQFEADFAVSQEPLYEISGKVLGVPTEGGVGWALFNSSGEHLNSLRFLAEGQQFFGFVPAGRYTLRFSARAGIQQLSATVPVNVAADLSGIQAVLAPENSIPVNIRVESNGAPRPAQSGPQAAVRLLPLSGGLEQNEYSSVPHPQGSAQSSIFGAPPGMYSVEVSSWGDFYVQSATSGATDILSEPLVIPAGSKIDPIEVVLRDDGGQVGGSVQGQGSGIALLVRERGATNEIKMMGVQAGGTFSFDQVRPGDYSVLGIQSPGDFEYKDPRVLEPYLSRAAHVTVAARQNVSVNLEMISLGK